MKKILILATVGGFLEKFEKSNVSILQELGYEVHYAANLNHMNYLFSDEDWPERRKVVMHSIDIQKSPFKLRSNYETLKEIIRLIYREDIHVLHCHTPVGGLLGRVAARKCRAKGWKIKVIYTAHGFHFYQGAPIITGLAYYLAERYLAKETDVLITINREDYENTRFWNLHDNGKVLSIPGVGLDMECFKPVDKREKYRIREKLHLAAQGQQLFLSVGELNKNKNHMCVLHALEQMRRSGMDLSKLKYGICGEGPYRRKLESYISRHHLESVVSLYGYCQNITEYLAGADFVVFPSHREGLGMAALEALSMGIPVLAADNRGTREYMKNGVNGFVCRWNDTKGYQKWIQKLCLMSEEELDVMKTNCRNMISRFEQKHTDEIMRRIYETLEVV